MDCLQEPRPAPPRAWQDGAECRICITSTVPDSLNSNAVIRHHLAEGFRALLPGASVTAPGYHAAIDSILATQPTLVLAVGGLAIDGVDLQSVKRAADRAGAPLAFWLHDDPYEFDYAFKTEGLADLVFTNEAWCVPHYGPGRARHLPLAASPSVHYREIQPADGHDIDLFFCGVGYPNRISLLRQAQRILQRHASVICGAGWPQDLGFAINKRLNTAAFCDHAQRALLTMNIARDHNIANRRLGLPASTPGPRTFEVALAGSAQIVFAESLEILDYFDVGTEILIAESIDDLQTEIERGLDEPEHLVDIARRAQCRALAEHTYAHRAATIVDCLQHAGLWTPKLVGLTQNPLPSPVQPVPGNVALGGVRRAAARAGKMVAARGKVMAAR